MILFLYIGAAAVTLLFVFFVIAFGADRRELRGELVPARARRQLTQTLTQKDSA